MKISIITVFPELYDNFLNASIIAKAVEKKLIEFRVIRLSDMCEPKERIDEPTCGPGAGMIIKPEVIEKALANAEQHWGPGFKIFFSPQGVTLTQKVLTQAAKTLFTPPAQENESTHTSSGHIILVCPRYEGMDARVEEHYADLLLSIGDYVLMGGDLPAQVFLEGILRLLPGVVGNWNSVEHDSFTGPLLDFPEYGLPLEWNNKQVPPVLLSGNHAVINAWRKKEASKKTILNRFDWFAANAPSKELLNIATECIPPHYVVLMHADIVLKGGQVGESSIASLDIHDIARSGTTYGIKKFFMVSPLKDQQAILNEFLNFWRSEEGKNYNTTRHQSISSVIPAFSLQEVLDSIKAQHGIDPILIATSAKEHAQAERINYNDQSVVWQQQKPVLLILGTGQGLADQLLEKCDYILAPLEGMTGYNHLSVRTAAGIIFDRWLGLHPKNPRLSLQKRG